MSASAVVLSACGGSDPVDSGGMTSGDRAAAQRALDQLQGTAIPRTLLSLSAAASAIPQACQVHLRGKGLFDVFLFWKPYAPPQSFAWLTGTIGERAANDRFRVGYAPALSSARTLLKANAGGTFSKPQARCQILANGSLQLLPNEPKAE